MIQWIASDKSYSSPGWREDITAKLSTAPRWSTSIPGGFKQATLSLRCDRLEAWKWYEERQFYGLTAYSQAGRTLWEGRVEEVRLT
jgi:hypothetical protein